MKKEYLYALGAFIVGSVAGSLITGYILSKKHKENLEHEIFETKLQFQKKDVDFPLDKDVKEDEDYIYEDHYPENYNVEHDHSTGKYTYHKENPELDEYIKQHFEEKEKRRDEEILKELSKAHQNGIEVIHPHEFGHVEEYEQYYVTYYEDGILIDEDGEEILDIPYLLGEGFEDKFGIYGEDPDILTIRNDSLQTYFEVTKEHCEYYRDVLVKRYSTADDED